MNNQLQLELTKVITNINKGTDSAWEFISSQTPDIVQQLLFWHGIKSFIIFCFLFLITSIGFISVPILFRYSKILSLKSKEKEETGYRYYHDPVPYTIMWGLPLVITIMLFVSLVFSDLTWLQIWLTPKVWLLEYVTRMVK